MSAYGNRRNRNRGGNGKDRASYERDTTELARRYAEVCGDAVSCGKRRYKTKGEALVAVGRTANHPRNPTGINGDDGLHRLSVYRCPTCEGRPWHVGHTPGQKR